MSGKVITRDVLFKELTLKEQELLAEQWHMLISRDPQFPKSVKVKDVYDVLAASDVARVIFWRQDGKDKFTLRISKIETAMLFQIKSIVKSVNNKINVR